ncbi:jg4043 [Pararge aegeria aegeria]|uniref:Jg4043 protein n=1 Tax=Pararge aegeria aegeria TaxID=348720 RepID=A0A8S4R5C9_9NEOP|nr:jg4043 [Pararge aegeria aegeria]
MFVVYSWSSQLYDMDSLVSSMSSLSMPGLRPGVWGAPDPPAQGTAAPPRDFNPWTAKHPMEEFILPPKDQE